MSRFWFVLFCLGLIVLYALHAASTFWGFFGLTLVLALVGTAFFYLGVHLLNGRASLAAFYGLGFDHREMEHRLCALSLAIVVVGYDLLHGHVLLTFS